MDIKQQNLSKMSKEQLYSLVVQKEISDADRAAIKSELVKREAEILYNQAKRARPGDTTPVSTGMIAKGQGPAQARGAKRKMTLGLTQWLLIIFILVVLGSLVYAAFIR